VPRTWSHCVNRVPVSILIAAFNSESTLGETLDSVLAQTSPDWEAIVVDDGSCDGTLAIARSYHARDNRIRVLHQENQGAGAARNRAASEARGEWLLAVDADDLLLPEALAQQLAFIARHPGYDICSWGMLLQSPDGSRRPWGVGEQHRAVESFSLRQMIQQNRMTVSTAISARLFSRIGGFRNLFMEDYDLWLRALVGGARHLHNPIPLGVYRISESSKNTNSAARDAGTAEILRDLAGRASISPEDARLALRLSRYYGALESRRKLEARLLRGETAGARGDYLRARDAYLIRTRWLLGLAVMASSPRLFARLFCRPAAGKATNV
jgi:glycosyltransferase involved in cell wall biosynthesis